MSGFLASRDQSEGLWFMQELRRVKGQPENLLIKAGETAALTAYVLRPASVLPREMSLPKLVQELVPSIGVDALSAVALEFVVCGDGEEHKTVWENGDLVAKRKKVFLSRK
jgi:hypothetical protein